MGDSASKSNNVPADGLKPGNSARMEELRRARAAQLAQWAELELKQDYLDEEWMLQCARKAGIARMPVRAEPATVKRLRS